MKTSKIINTLFLTLSLFVLFSCQNDTNSDTESYGEYSFLCQNKIADFPETIDEDSWYCFLSAAYDKNATIEENMNYIIFVYLTTDGTWEYWGYLDGNSGMNSTTSNISDTINNSMLSIEYWCKITESFYNSYKDKLPDFLGFTFKYSFLKVNPIDTFPTSIENDAWYCIINTSHPFRVNEERTDDSYSSSLELYFPNYLFIYLTKDSNGDWSYFGYLDGNTGKNSEISNIYDNLKYAESVFQIEYWCEITSEFYETNKSLLPEFLSSAPTE